MKTYIHPFRRNTIRIDLIPQAGDTWLVSILFSEGNAIRKTVATRADAIAHLRAAASAARCCGYIRLSVVMAMAALIGSAIGLLLRSFIY